MENYNTTIPNNVLDISFAGTSTDTSVANVTSENECQNTVEKENTTAIEISEPQEPSVAPLQDAAQRKKSTTVDWVMFQELKFE